MLSKQEVFDTTVKYLLTMKKPAVEGVSCRYRTSDGNKCAVGFWIPDDHPGVKEENLNISHLLMKWDEKSDYPLIPEIYEYSGLFYSLQVVHDNSTNWGPNGMNSRGVEALKNITKYAGLEWNFENEFQARKQETPETFVQNLKNL